MVSNDHQSFDAKNNFIPINPNFVGFQELELSTSFSRSWPMYLFVTNP